MSRIETAARNPLERLLPLLLLAVLLLAAGVARAEFLYRHTLATGKVDVASTMPPPVWATAPDLGTVVEETAVSIQLDAGPAVDYELVGGALPTGVTLSASGLVSGMAPAVSSDIAYSFTVRAANEAGEAQRTFSLTVQDVPSGMQAFGVGTHSFVVPSEVTRVLIKAWGAGGGAGGEGPVNGRGGGGGGAGFASASVAVTPGETLTVITGSKGGVGGRFSRGGGGGGGSAVLRGTTPLIVGGGGGGGGGGYANAGLLGLGGSGSSAATSPAPDGQGGGLNPGDGIGGDGYGKGGNGGRSGIRSGGGGGGGGGYVGGQGGIAGEFDGNGGRGGYGGEGFIPSGGRAETGIQSKAGGESDPDWSGLAGRAARDGRVVLRWGPAAN